MMISIPAVTQGTPTTGDDEVAWRRELKQLRVRVLELEAERKISLRPSIDTTRNKEHGVQCGMPCHVTVSINTPEVTCSVCDTKLEPIEVLRDFANHERNFCYSLEHLRKEKWDLAVEVKKLKALRNRLRADARKLLPAIDSEGGKIAKVVQQMRADRQLDHVLAQEKP